MKSIKFGATVMTKTLSLILLLFFALIIMVVAQEKTTDMTNYDFEKAWKEVTDFESQGLPESALKKVEEIYTAAKKGNVPGQLAKAIIHRLKFMGESEDIDFSQHIRSVHQELENSQFPLTPMLHSMLAEMYWRYYEQNRWKFHDRSETVNTEDSEIESWSLNKLVKETHREYALSLEGAERSKATAVDVFVEVLYRGNEKGQAFRPTLYDFLATRALDFFKNDVTELTRPANEFTLSDERLFADGRTFAELELPSQDTLSRKYQALQILQELTTLHQRDRDAASRVEVELERLRFVRAHFVHPNKDQLYLKALEQLEERIRPNPAAGLVFYEQAQLYVEKAQLYNPLLSDAHKWDYKTAFEICQTVKSRYPETDGAKLCSNLQSSIETKELGAAIETINVPNQDFRSLVTYRNFSTLYYRIIKVTRKEVRDQREKQRKVSYDQQELMFLKYFLAKAPAKSGKYILPNDNDFHKHNIEVKLDAVPEGDYMIVYSNNESFSTNENGMAYTFTTMSNLAYLHRNTVDGETEFQIVHRQTGEPLGHVKGEAYFLKYNYQKGTHEYIRLTTANSDASGYLKFPYHKQYRNFIVNFSKGNDYVSTEQVDKGHGYDRGGGIYQYLQRRRTTKLATHFFLDRGIYRPGQTLYFKGLVLSTDGKTSSVVAGHSTTVRLYDVNGEEKGSMQVTTNEFGTYSGTFVLPTGGLTGEMRLEVPDGSGTSYFSVEEYKRPKFEVTFNPVKGSFRIGDQVRVPGKAMAYSGASLDGAQVQYRVVRNADFPFWWWCRWGYYPPAPETEITNGVTQSDGNGDFTITFDAIADPTIDPSSDPIFNYTVYADVTDLNGETHSASTFLQVAYKSLRVGVTMTDINREDKNATQREFNIITQNISGEFEPAKGNIEIHLLQSPARPLRSRLWDQPDRQLYTAQEFAKLFPLDLYADENNKYKWPRAKEVFSHAFNTAESKTFKLNHAEHWQDGEYLLVITSHDKEGKPVQEFSYFSVYAPSASSLPIADINYHRVLKSQGTPGETASILVGSATRINALYEVERDGMIVKKEWIALNNQQRSLSVVLTEEDRGNLVVHYSFVKDNRFYKNDFTIAVPFDNKDLEISFESFRNKLQPGQHEEWKIKVKGPKAEKVAAEMVATLYDESLDVFRANSFPGGFFGTNRSLLGWTSPHDFRSCHALVYSDEWNVYRALEVEHPQYNHLNWFNFGFGNNFGGRTLAKSARYRDGDIQLEAAADEVAASAPAEEEEKSDSLHSEVEVKKDQPNELASIKARTNFNETAFFFPHLQTNEAGEIMVTFTIPEALTRWKMLGFAHTKDMQSQATQNQLVTQKDLMVVPNQPRFFRENDTMLFTAKLTSLSDQPLVGQAQLMLFDALTMRPIDDLTRNNKNDKYFSLDAKKSSMVEWEISIPEGIQAITYRVVAKAGTFSDGEEMTLPVVTNRMLVTETLPLPVRGNQKKTFKFDKMISSESKTLKHHKFTLEYTSNPAWYAVQALPYLMEYPYDCVEQTFSRFYANSIATHIANSNPKIKQVFETWKNIQPEALLSNLEKNQDLKTALLEETPWVLQAKDESQRKRMIGVLFDLNRMAGEQEKALDKVIKAQTSNGGFAWFNGMPEDRYMTQHIVAGLAHLDALGIKSIRGEGKAKRMIEKAVGYLDREVAAEYARLKDLAKQKKIKLEEEHIAYIDYHYLYARSYVKDIPVPQQSKEAFDYFISQAAKYWIDTNLYTQGMACLALQRFGNSSTPSAMIKSFSEKAIHSDELGMYWKTTRGYYWYQAPIETQALMIEVYDEVAKDQAKVEALKVWLLKQKQTQDWKTTKATVEACYALLRRGSDLLTNTQLVNIKVGDDIIDPGKSGDKVEAGTGYFKTSWSGSQINRKMGTIEVSKSDDGVAWGAAYWQYFEQLDKITPAETPLKIKKELFVQQNTPNGPVITPISSQALKVGDLIKVRIEIRVDRNMEYVHLKDMRAAAFEPVSTISTYRFQDGLYYYENTRDLATNFFMGYLPKGNYVFEYDLRVAQRGDFSNGITTIQCMYAPEFTSHSAGVRVQVK